MEDQKYYIITKTIPGNVFFTLSPIDNTEQHRIIKLTEEMPSTRVPKTWALGVFLDNEIFHMFEKGCFTFENINEVLQAAIEENVYFGKELNFKPADVGYKDRILKVLVGGVRTEIFNLIKDEKKENILLVARENIDQIAVGVISLLEKELGMQIKIDEE